MDDSGFHQLGCSKCCVPASTEIPIPLLSKYKYTNSALRYYIDKRVMIVIEIEIKIHF